MALDMEQLLKGGANAFMAAVIAKRVAGDVVRSIPYPSLGAVTLLGVVSGILIGRTRSRRHQPAAHHLGR